MAARKRRQLLVDRKVQGAFLLRIVVYWFLCTLGSGIVLMCWMMLTVPAFHLRLPIAEFWEEFGPAFLVSALMLPILLYDCLKLTNRMAGALYRVRREMRSIANGDPANVIKFRDGDFWPGFADEFNAVRLRISQLEDRLRSREPTAQLELVEQAISSLAAD